MLVGCVIAIIVSVSTSCTWADLIPSPKWANACVMFSGTLICYGGRNQTGLTDDMYSLDLYQSFNTSAPAWNQLEPVGINIPVAYTGSAPVTSPQGFMINGGERGKSNTQYDTMIYDSIRNMWAIPVTQKEKTEQQELSRIRHTLTPDRHGRVWIWGGMSDTNSVSESATYYNTWIMIDTATWRHTYPVVVGSPPPRIDHTATLVSRRYILILGGLVYSHSATDMTGALTLNPVSMNLLLFFDTIRSRWINATAGGNIPAPRHGHSAIMSADSRNIVIFGGGMPDDTHQLFNDIFILELPTLSWSSPSIKGVPPKPRIFHQVCLVDDQMLVMFGMAGDGSGHDDINVLSLSSWSWISSYTSNPSWLSGNMTSTSGIVKNSTGTYSDTHSNSQDPNSAPSFPADPDNNTIGGGNPVGTDSDLDDVHGSRRLKAGIIAGVVSGGVVVLGGGIFLALSVLIYYHRQAYDTSKRNDHASRRSFDSCTQPDLILTPLDCYKPDNRSSYLHAIQATDEQQKPDERI